MFKVGDILRDDESIVLVTKIFTNQWGPSMQILRIQGNDHYFSSFCIKYCPYATLNIVSPSTIMKIKKVIRKLIHPVLIDNLTYIEILDTMKQYAK